MKGIQNTELLTRCAYKCIKSWMFLLFLLPKGTTPRVLEREEKIAHSHLELWERILLLRNRTAVSTGKGVRVSQDYPIGAFHCKCFFAWELVDKPDHCSQTPERRVMVKNKLSALHILIQSARASKPTGDSDAQPFCSLCTTTMSKDLTGTKLA